MVVAPLRLELTPAGPVDLPLGQMARLQGWAHYSGGRVVAVPGQRLTWQIDKTVKPAPGIELRGDKVAALKAGGGPLSVSATYFGKRSNAVVLKSVEADPNLTLRVDVDRTIRLAGEPGQLALAATCPRGDVELVPELADYKSSDAGGHQRQCQAGRLPRRRAGRIDRHRQPSRRQAAGDRETPRLRSGQGPPGLRSAPPWGWPSTSRRPCPCSSRSRTAPGRNGRPWKGRASPMGSPSRTPSGGRRRCCWACGPPSPLP